MHLYYFFADWVEYQCVYIFSSVLWVEKLLLLNHPNDIHLSIVIHIYHHLWAVCWYSGLCTGSLLSGIGVPLTWIYQIAASSIEVVLFFFKQMYSFILSQKNATALSYFYKLLFSWFKIPRYQGEIILLAIFQFLKGTQRTIALLHNLCSV